MVTIINKYTSEVITKYNNASKKYADKDSFIADVKGSGSFRSRWHALVEYFIPLGNSVQCILKDGYAVKECMK